MFERKCREDATATSLVRIDANGEQIEFEFRCTCCANGIAASNHCHRDGALLIVDVDFARILQQLLARVVKARQLCFDRRECTERLDDVNSACRRFARLGRASTLGGAALGVFSIARIAFGGAPA